MCILWNIRINIRQKLALTGIFALIIMTIIFSIIRVALVAAPHTSLNLIWFGLWANIEMTVCMCKSNQANLSDSTRY